MTKPTGPSTLKLPANPAPKRPAARPQEGTPATRPAAKPRMRPITSLRTKPPAAPVVPEQDPGERLAKRVAALVPCSRSEAEQYIEGGWVRVDGKVIEEPQFRVQNQAIAIDPNATLIDVTSITLVLHKPADWVDGTAESLAKLNRSARRAPFDDARTLLVAAKRVVKDPSGIRMLQRHFKDLTAAVPLETAASGLIVFTQDWRIVRKLTEDAGSLEHEVIVDVKGEVSDKALHELNRELQVDGQYLPHTKVSINSATPERSKLRFAIKGAHRGLIAYLCQRAELEILEMRRIRLGRITLSDLPVGQWRYLAPNERF